MYLIHSSLAWGFLLVAAPLLIHLLNLLRQRRVPWAAMEFLLQSHRKQRHWVWLRQLLLLLCRMLAMALAVAMLARVVTQDRWARWFQAEQTHYYLLLDDSYSMADRAGATTALDRGIAAVRAMVESANRRDRHDRFSLLRFSEAHPSDRPGSSSTGGPAVPSNAVVQDLSDAASWQRAWETLTVTEKGVGPLACLTWVSDLISQSQYEKPVVVIVSDFRRAQWEDAPEIQDRLRQLRQAGAALELVRCVDRQHANLTIQAMRQITPLAAAGVPLQWLIEIKNDGPEDAQQVPIRLTTRPLEGPREGGFPGNALPDQIIPVIPAGGSAPLRVQVVLDRPGEHVVEARLPDDALELDNRAWQVVAVADHLPVLVIAEEEAAEVAFFLQSVFQPDPSTSTGFRAEIQPSTFLRQASPAELQRFVTIYLLDSPVLDQQVYEKLSSYVTNGGGLACFAGPRSDTEFWNSARQSAAANSSAMLDLVARRIEGLPPRGSEDLPDLSPLHPVFQVLQGERNPWLATIQMERYLQVELPEPAKDTTIPRWEIAAQLRGQQPLAATRRWGRGRVWAFFSTLGPRWNNWARQPSFVVFVLSLQDFLTQPRDRNNSKSVGDSWQITYPAGTYRKNFTLTYPGADPFREAQSWSGNLDESDDGQQVRLQLPQAGRAESAIITPWRGPYQLNLVRTSGEVESSGFSVNVDPAEGDLRTFTAAELESEYAGLALRIRSPEDANAVSAASDRAHWSQWLLIPLAFLLLGEQILAYFASYHPSPKPA